MSSPLDEVVRHAGEWLRGNGPMHEIVISTRVRLARNLRGFLFLSRANNDMKTEIAEAVTAAARRAALLKDLVHIDVDALDELDRTLLVERHLISRQHAEASGARRVAFLRNESAAIMVNEEDHLRLQVMRSGLLIDEAWEQIKTFLRRAGEIARAKQITIGIEPLRKQESNIINTGAEALRLVDAVNHPHVKMIIDYYHLRVEKEDPEIVRHARNQIVHLHFANPQGRRWPRESAEDPEYGRFFSILKEIDYQGGLSIEGSGRFENDAEASLAFFRDQLK